MPRRMFAVCGLGCRLSRSFSRPVVSRGSGCCGPVNVSRSVFGRSSRPSVRVVEVCAPLGPCCEDLSARVMISEGFGTFQVGFSTLGLLGVGFGSVGAVLGSLVRGSQLLVS